MVPNYLLHNFFSCIIWFKNIILNQDMSTKIFQKIKEKEKKRQELLSELIESQTMVRGSFCQIFVRCGREACWCNKEKGHPHKRMSMRENGRNFSRAVPIEDHAWIEEMTNNYRAYRKKRRHLIKLEQEIKELLDQYEEKCVKQTKKGKNYLEVNEAVSEAKSKKGSGIAKKQKT
jgi:hypothetical protein